MSVSLVTGANKGIGYAIAQQLVDAGHTVYVAARDVDRGHKAALTLGARFVQLDVTDDASVQSALESVITSVRNFVEPGTRTRPLAFNAFSTSGKSVRTASTSRSIFEFESPVSSIISLSLL